MIHVYNLQAKPWETLTSSTSVPGGKKTKTVASSSLSSPTAGRLKDSPNNNGADKTERRTRENGSISGTNGVHSGGRRKESVTSPGSQTGGRGKESLTSPGNQTVGRGKESVTSPGSQTGSRGKESVSSTGSVQSTGKSKDSVSSSVSVQSGGRMKESVSSTSSVLSGGKKTTKNKSKPLYFWNNADVSKWLKKHALHLHQLYGDMLVQQDVTGSLNSH